jgi:hypothetical protein
LDENDGKKEKIETTPKNVMAKERDTPHAPNIIANTVWERKW